MKKVFFFFLSISTFTLQTQGQVNFVKVSKDLYINKYEVSNADYRKYTDYLRKHDPGTLLMSSLPDTAIWKRTNEPYVNYYFSYASYSDYPLVGISYENATAYCKWLTGEYNADKDRKFKKVLFRLPTAEEWTYAANGGDNNMVYTWNTPFLLDRNKGYMCNFLRVGDNLITYNDSLRTYRIALPEGRGVNPQDRATIPGPVRNYSPNQFGIYNMCGNIAEMVQEKGIARGGSFNDPGYDVRIASVKKYTSASVEIGFRVAMEVLEK